MRGRFSRHTPGGLPCRTTKLMHGTRYQRSLFLLHEIPPVPKHIHKEKGNFSMNVGELLLIAVGLSADAFAVALGKGLALRRVELRHALTVGLYFGLFQGIMPVLGYCAGSLFADAIRSFDHWVAFLLLGAIGVNMIRESFDKKAGCEAAGASLAFRNMLPLAVATSIDVTFAFFQVRILPAAGLICAMTLVISMAGVKLGHLCSAKLKSKAELAGGVILVCLGTKILVDHLTAAI